MRYWLVVLILFLCTIVVGQNTVLSFRENLLLKSNINTQNESFSIQNNNQSILVNANNTYRLEVGANYKFLGLKIGFSPSSRSSDFKSKFLNSQLNIFIKQWIQSFEYRKVKGFYQENNAQLLAQFPDLKTTSWLGTTSYVLNDNFSLKHLTHLNEWQRETAGSLVPTLKYGFNRLSNIIDYQKVAENSFDLSFAPAYYYTWAFKDHWFISSSIAPAVGVRFTTEKLNTAINKDTFISRALDLTLQFGYTSETISAGASFNFDSNAINKDLTQSMVNDKSYASLYFGYRFTPPNFLKRTVEQIESTIGL
ncbi:DUF4421 family protein [Olleya sp. UBA1516]|uniref:DUF4421 family protein n=1 Tax=Olleya sp. UBA1516 TaxID=1947013 RepID=UPI0025F0D316|nr:DUF4421 family protein [Olleya sp. UBA1516]|tara:strand:- start:90546 stop:91472 length:927 start_codon:yes stop_codon:yes gene_type:complete